MVSDYTGLTILEVGDLNYLDYLRYRRDAFVSLCKETEEGREYLKNAWRIQQSKPDRESLRKNFGKEG